jgi:hypothetical protein
VNAQIEFGASQGADANTLALGGDLRLASSGIINVVERLGSHTVMAG